MSETFSKVAVLGAGAWGTALAQVVARAGREAVLWAHEPSVIEAIKEEGENAVYLPGVDIEEGVTPTAELADIADCGAVLAVTPAQHIRGVLERARPHLREGAPVVLCAKGIERETGKMMTEVLDEALPGARPAVLSGPSFAIDVARGLPTAVTLAAEDEALGQSLAGTLSIPTFRPYLATDLIGAEIGGAVKNVLAIACGVSEGKDLGASAHAALMTRGFAEMTRLGVAMGAKSETLAGLCGLGDLMLTCSSTQSRNMSCGMALGRGVPLEAILTGRRAVTEGVATAPAVVALAKEHGVEMPICEAVAAILDDRLSVDEAIEALLNRPLKAESV